MYNILDLNWNPDRDSHSKNVDDTKSNDRYFIYAKRLCPRRSLDASKLHKYLLKNSLQPVSNPRKADLIFVYTCGGFNEYEERSVRTIEKSLQNKSARVVITGCLPKINPKLLDGYRNTLIIASEETEKMDQLIDGDFSYSNCSDCSVVDGIHDLVKGNHFGRIKRRFGLIRRHLGLNTEFVYFCFDYMHRKIWSHKDGDSFSVFSKDCYRLEIARGCLGDCSYCAIKQSMPKFNSKPEEQIVENFKSGLRENYKKFALVAGDIGCYGLDLNTNLPALISKLFSVEGDYKILFVDLNARWFVRYHSKLIPILKDNVKKVARIIMPIQSGSNRILKLMNRHYNIEEVKKCLSILQRNVPKIKVDTHILVGFPGETDEDFRKSLDLIREIEFSNVEIYPYQDRPNTVSSNLPDKISEEVINKRIESLEHEIRLQKADHQ